MSKKPLQVRAGSDQVRSDKEWSIKILVLIPSVGFNAGFMAAMQVVDAQGIFIIVEYIQQFRTQPLVLDFIHLTLKQ